MRKSTIGWLEMASQNRLIAFVLAMVVVVPLVATPAEASVRGIAPLAFECLAVLLVVALLWRGRWNLSAERIASFLRTGANLPVALFLFVVVISCVLSPQKGYSLQETLRIGAGVLLYFVVLSQFRRSEHLYRLSDTLIFVTIAVSIVSFTEYGMRPEQHATGVFGDHQLFGSFLMILLPIVAIIAIAEKNLNRQLAAQVAATLAATSLLLAHSRSAWLGAAAGLTVLGLLAIYTQARQNRTGSRKSRLMAQRHQFVLPVMLLLASTTLFLLLTPVAGSIFERAGTLANLKGQDAWEDRQNMWRGAVKMIKQRPFSGFGVGLYPYYQFEFTGTGLPLDRMTTGCKGMDSGQIRPCGSSSANASVVQQNSSVRENAGGACCSNSGPAGARILPRNGASAVAAGVNNAPRKLAPASLGEQAHNFYLQTAAELGLPGLILILAVLATFWVSGARRVATMELGVRRHLLMGCLASSVAFAIDACASPSWQIGQVSMFFWLILGVGVNCMLPRTRHFEETPPVPAPARFTQRGAVLASVAVLAVLTVAVQADDACPACNQYGALKSVTIVPQNTTVGCKGCQSFQLLANFTTASGVDVTCCPGTTFTVTGGSYTQSNCNGSTVCAPANQTKTETLQVNGCYKDCTGVTKCSVTFVTFKCP